MAINIVMATTLIRRLCPLRRFRTHAGAVVIIGVLFVSRGHGHVWCERILIGFICFDVVPRSEGRKVFFLPLSSVSFKVPVPCHLGGPKQRGRV